MSACVHSQGYARRSEAHRQRWAEDCDFRRLRFAPLYLSEPDRNPVKINKKKNICISPSRKLWINFWSKSWLYRMTLYMLLCGFKVVWESTLVFVSIFHEDSWPLDLNQSFSKTGIQTLLLKVPWSLLEPPVCRHPSIWGTICPFQLCHDNRNKISY